VNVAISLVSTLLKFLLVPCKTFLNTRKQALRLKFPCQMRFKQSKMRS
jgi:hypothetical protein